jgi:hypothetical protein
LTQKDEEIFANKSYQKVLLMNARKDIGLLEIVKDSIAEIEKNDFKLI